MLIKKGAKLDNLSSEGNSLLLKAAIEDNQTTMYYLLSIGANIHLKNKLNYTAFDYVVEKSFDIFNRHDEIENAFIAAGADINSKGLMGSSLLFNAIEDHKSERIRYLILKEADAYTQNAKGQRPNVSKVKQSNS